MSADVQGRLRAALTSARSTRSRSSLSTTSQRATMRGTETEGDLVDCRFLHAPSFHCQEAK